MISKKKNSPISHIAADAFLSTSICIRVASTGKNGGVDGGTRSARFCVLSFIVGPTRSSTRVVRVSPFARGGGGHVARVLQPPVTVAVLVRSGIILNIAVYTRCNARVHVVQNVILYCTRRCVYILYPHTPSDLTTGMLYGFGRRYEIMMPAYIYTYIRARERILHRRT